MEQPLIVFNLLYKTFLAHLYIPNTIDSQKLVDLVVCCGGKVLKHFLGTAGRNAMNISYAAVVNLLNKP